MAPTSPDHAPGRADDDRGAHASPRRAHGRDLVLVDLDVQHLAVGHRPGAAPPCGIHVRVRHDRWSRVTVRWRERGGDEGVRVHRRAEPVRLRGRDQARRDAVPVLDGSALLEARDVVRRAQEEEVSDLVEADVRARVLREPVVRGEAAGGELDVQAVGELPADAADRLARRAGCEVGALDEDEVDTGLGKVKGDAGADDAASDDDDLGAFGKRVHVASRLQLRQDVRGDFLQYSLVALVPAVRPWPVRDHVGEAELGGTRRPAPRRTRGSTARMPGRRRSTDSGRRCR